MIDRRMLAAAIALALAPLLALAGGSEETTAATEADTTDRGGADGENRGAGTGHGELFRHRDRVRAGHRQPHRQLPGSADAGRTGRGRRAAASRGAHAARPDGDRAAGKRGHLRRHPAPRRLEPGHRRRRVVDRAHPAAVDGAPEPAGDRPQRRHRLGLERGFLAAHGAPAPGTALERRRSAYRRRLHLLVRGLPGQRVAGRVASRFMAPPGEPDRRGRPHRADDVQPTLSQRAQRARHRSAPLPRGAVPAVPLSGAVPRGAQLRGRRPCQGGGARELGATVSEQVAGGRATAHGPGHSHHRPVDHGRGGRTGQQVLLTQPLLLEGRYGRQPTPLRRHPGSPAAREPGGGHLQDHRRRAGLRAAVHYHGQLPALQGA